MPFTDQVRHGFDVNGEIAVCEIPARRVGYRAFVGVFPPALTKKSLRVNKKSWRVRKFEIQEDLMEEWFGEEALVDSESIWLDTLDEVEVLLAKWGVDSGTLQPSWKTDWPL